MLKVILDYGLRNIASVPAFSDSTFFVTTNQQINQTLLRDTSLFSLLFLCDHISGCAYWGTSYNWVQAAQ